MCSMDRISYRLVANKDELEEAFEVRRRVFVSEQGIDENLEWDGHDGEALHMVVKDGEMVVGTARVLFLPDKQAKIERMAVLEPFRNRGIGRGIISFLSEELKTRDIEEAVLHAQHTAVGFYRACGFKETGLPFWEADIKHIKMERRL
ncbi:MAG: GNAT family N-acetyltransferase [Dehalococcoidales bacterium]|nr:MAG: GNAT family N-acetyltransferase [Dehalococcoidales bacterium]